MPRDKAQGPGLGGEHDPVVRGIVWRNGQDADLGLVAGHLPHEIDAAHAGQHQVDHQHIRLQFFNLGKGRVPVMGHAHYLDALHLARALRHRARLFGTGIHDQYTDWLFTHGQTSIAKVTGLASAASDAARAGL